MNYHSRDDRWVVFLLLLVAGFVAFMAYDRMTGATKLTMGTVYDRWHEHQSHTETSTDSKGRRTTSTHTHDYYWVKYRRDDGVNDRYDVGWWHFNDYSTGQRIVVNTTVGGVSGCEYNCGIAIFTGGEAK
jgi:hypothetical protein